MNINSNMFSKHRVTRLASLVLGIAVLLSSGVALARYHMKALSSVKTVTKPITMIGRLQGILTN